MKNLDGIDLLKDWDYDDISSEINLLYTYLESTRDRVYEHIKNPDSKVEKETWEHCLKKRIAEILFTRSYGYEPLAELYAHFSYYSKKCNNYKEEADYIEKIFKDIIYTFHYYHEHF